MHHAPWVVDPVNVLTRRELAKVLASLTAKADQSAQARMNRVVIRLACCVGLRVSEIAAVHSTMSASIRVVRTCGSVQRPRREAGAVSCHCGGTRGRSKT